jgi:hypothetical protein
MSLTTRLRHKSPVLPASERELAILRLTGRLGMVLGQTVRELVFPDMHDSSCRRILRGLVERKLLWHANVPNANDAGRLQGRTPRVYGLTEDGRQLLDTFGAEPHDGTFERLIVRSKQAPGTPLSSTLVTETYISDWCASLIDQVRRTPLLAGVHVQRRYAVTDANGTPIQTLGALIVLAFDPNLKTLDRPTWGIPWLTDGAISPSWRVVRLALEVDTGFMAMRAIFDMAQTYQHLAGTGMYQKILGGPIQPVIITPPGRRARAVAEVWMGAWPGSPALLSSVERTAHDDYGVLWGEYLVLHATPLQRAPLLGKLLGTVDQWATKTQHWPITAPR